MAVTTKKTFAATTNATTTVFSPVSIQLHNQDDLDVYVTLSGGTRVLQNRNTNTNETADATHKQVNDTTGLYFPAVSVGTQLYNYQLSSDNNTITFNSALPQGAVVFCERRTRDASGTYTNFASGSTIRARDLNDSSEQSNFTAQDARNKALEIEGALFNGNAISSSFINSDNIVDGSIQTVDIANDAITNAKIANDQIDSEHYVDGSIDSQHIGTGQVQHGNLANNCIDGDNIQDDVINSEHYAAGSIDTEHIADSQVTTVKIAADAINGTKIADNSINSEHYVDGSIDHEHLANDVVDGDNIADNSINSEHYVDGSIDTAHIGDSQVTTAKIAGGAITDAKIATGTLDGRYFTETELTGGALDGRYFTETESDARYFNISSGETIKDGDVFPDNDTTIATTAAINDRIIDLIDDVGGFVPIANETSFPTTNPDVNNGTGTIVSVKTASTTLTPSGTTVTIANGAGTGNTVTITGVTNPISQDFGFLVETTTTLHTYSFHRLIPKATEVTTVASNIGIINSVNTNSSNINTVASSIANVNTVVQNIADVNTVGTSIGNVNAVAGALGAAITYTVTVSGGVFYIDGQSKPTLTLTRGFTYTFDQSDSTNNNHPLAFRDSSNASYTTGVTVNGTAGQAGSSVVFAVPSNAPNSLLYYCTQHGNSMGNTISVIDDNIGIVAGSIGNVNTTAGSITNVNNVGNSITNVNTVASNIGTVNDFAARYSSGATNPTTNLDTGDLFFNTTANELKVYNGSSWQGGVTAQGNLYTDNKVDLHLNQSNPTAGYVLSWNGSDYAWVDNAGFTNTDVDTHLNQSNPTSGYVLSWNGSDYAWVDNAGYTDSDVNTHLNQSTANSNQVMSWNGTDYAWVDQSSGLVGGGNEQLFVEAENEVNNNFTTTTNKNYVSASPLTVASGVTVTIVAGSTMAFV